MSVVDKLAALARIVEVYEINVEDDNGDKHLSSPGYAMEAISNVINGWPENAIVKEFLDYE